MGGVEAPRPGPYPRPPAPARAALTRPQAKARARTVPQVAGWLCAGTAAAPGHYPLLRKQHLGGKGGPAAAHSGGPRAVRDSEGNRERRAARFVRHPQPGAG